MSPEQLTEGERLTEATERVKEYLRMAKEANGGNPFNRDQIIEIAKMIQKEKKEK